MRAVDMVAAESGGVVSEDVMRELFNLSPVDRPFIDSIGTTDGSNPKKEFTDKVLAAASSTAGSVYEGQDLSSVDDTTTGLRYGNYHQNQTKVVDVSNRGRAVDTTYGTDEWLQQVMDLQKELKRNQESAAVSRNAATAEVAATTAPLMGGAATWCIHNTQRGGTGANAVLDGTGGDGGTPTTAPVAGDKRAMTETMLKAALRGLYDDGANPTNVLSTPTMIGTISDYMFTSSARVATLTSEAPQGNRSGAGEGNGGQSGGITAQGAVNMYVSNWGTVTLTPDRFAVPYTANDTGDVVDVIVYDSAYGCMSYLQDFNTKPLANVSLGQRSAINVDSCYIPEATHSLTTIADITASDAMTA